MNQPRYPLSPQDVTAVRAYRQRALVTQPYGLDHRQAEGEWDQSRRDPVTAGLVQPLRPGPPRGGLDALRLADSPPLHRVADAVSGSHPLSFHHLGAR